MRSLADISDVERVADALKHVHWAYFCPQYDPYMIQGALAFAVTASKRGPPWSMLSTPKIDSKGQEPSRYKQKRN